MSEKVVAPRVEGGTGYIQTCSSLLFSKDISTNRTRKVEQMSIASSIASDCVFPILKCPLEAAKYGNAGGLPSNALALDGEALTLDGEFILL